ncbi:hypothetical protein E2C01_062618 [Portunus trituberculatus]|uniref:Uncharacterized protein n=1 Tax=Portunus trituberculatus TaxID=210409 RepID=A0A5B7HGK4_PORTR|nr:hypothetical protein [Portunus trituberculatus]
MGRLQRPEVAKMTVATLLTVSRYLPLCGLYESASYHRAVLYVPRYLRLCVSRPPLANVFTPTSSRVCCWPALGLLDNRGGKWSSSCCGCGGYEDGRRNGYQEFGKKSVPGTNALWLIQSRNNERP